MWRLGLSGLAALMLVWAAMGFGACQSYGYEDVTWYGDRGSGPDDGRNPFVPPVREVDILFVIDNTRSMVAEQQALGEAFAGFSARLDALLGPDRYRIALITSGMESPACPPCPPGDVPIYSCLNETGENGRFQDRRGRNSGTAQLPQFEFTSEPDCRVITSANRHCFYEPASGRGVVLAGDRGCAYERPLAALRTALSSPLIDGWNAGFLRREAMLAVVLVSDEEDCGRVGDVSEQLQGLGSRICYYAARGRAPDGATTDPGSGEPYALTPVRATRDFLLGLKGGREQLVKLAAIVGIDPAGAARTSIEYASAEADAEVLPACSAPGCGIGHCQAMPATRALELVGLFGEQGLGASICQLDFSDTLSAIAEHIGCPQRFGLQGPLLDPDLVQITFNDLAVPRTSCSGSSPEAIETCSGPDDHSCTAGDCVATWSYHPPADPPEPYAPSGSITFAEHFDHCRLITDGEIDIDLIYADR